MRTIQVIRVQFWCIKQHLLGHPFQSNPFFVTVIIVITLEHSHGLIKQIQPSKLKTVGVSVFVVVVIIVVIVVVVAFIIVITLEPSLEFPNFFWPSKLKMMGVSVFVVTLVVIVVVVTFITLEPSQELPTKISVI